MAYPAFAPTADGSLPVLVICDVPLLLRGASAVVAEQPGMQVVGAVRGVGEALALWSKVRPGAVVVLMGGALGDGLLAVTELRRLKRTVPVVWMAKLGDDALVDRVLAAGAQGLVGLCDAECELPLALRVVQQGGMHMSRGVTGALERLRRARAQPAGAGASHGGLVPRPAQRVSGREEEVLRLLRRGLTCLGVAREMKLSVKTVETHASRLKEKLGVGTLAELRGGAGVTAPERQPA